MKHPAFFQHLYLNYFYGETIKGKNLLSKFFAPHIIPPKHFASQYSFLPPNDFLLAKKFSQNFAGKISSPKESAPPKHAPQNFLPRKFLSKKCVPHFAPLIFIQKNLLPKCFLPRICCQTFLLSIFLLTMKFYLQKSSKIFLQAKFPPHKNLSSKTWSQKFPLQKICFKKKLFSHPPPPPHPP